MMEEKGTGNGAKMLQAQTEFARQHGIAYLETEAAGSFNEKTFNGYYTWPRLGYDAVIPSQLREALPDALYGSIYLSDLMKTPEGRDWWKRNGDWVNVRFDLTPGALSLSRLHEYLREKGLMK